MNKHDREDLMNWDAENRILKIESTSNYSFVFLECGNKAKKVLICGYLKQIENELNLKSLARINRSISVRKSDIWGFEIEKKSKKVLLKNGELHLIPRRKQNLNLA